MIDQWLMLRGNHTASVVFSEFKLSPYDDLAVDRCRTASSEQFAGEDVQKPHAKIMRELMQVKLMMQIFSAPDNKKVIEIGHRNYKNMNSVRTNMEQSFLPETGENEYLKSDLPEVDFTTTIWVFVGLYYEEEKESRQYIQELIELGLLAWNYSITHEEELKQYIYLHFQHLCDTPINEVLSTLEKRKKAFYNEDKRIFEFYRIDWYIDDDFAVYVKFSN